ncbi:NAD(P)H-dependent oxidoreductase [Mesonia sp. HuA40]|uniref:NAD(P)H-dependent oxidoreductase n=1 Tax=Mesonia sp. HuA40 TaxID=2602761 RepID=UPI0011CC1C2E|nr:NAD(P)H-dependent oxidoreductase [Mesonia sp. HuA40]TXK70887.1 NAD(P)H-dependent oxidoreductase [Mesonia sp. HuA40]
MNVLSSLNWRYATKKFDTEKQVKRDKINLLKNAFNLTATSYGLQPVKMLIVKNKDLQEKMMPACFNQKQVNTASHILVLGIPETIDEQFVRNYFDLVKSIRQTPDAVLKPFQDFLVDDFKKSTTEKIERWATNQVYLALGNLLTVCAIESIDSCPMEGFNPEILSEVLSLKDYDLKPKLLLPIGYRADDDAFSQMAKVRKPLEETIIEL